MCRIAIILLPSAVYESPMSAIDRIASATANPLLVLTRLLLGLFFVWLGLTKLVPGWNAFETEGAALLTAMAQGKFDGQIALYLIGGWQVIAGLALCVVPAIRLSLVLLFLLLALYGLLVAFSLPALHDSNGLPTAFAELTLRNALLTIAALAVAAHTIRVTPSKASGAK